MCPSSEVLISLLLVLQIATLAPLQKKFTHLKSQLELKTYDLSLFEGRAEQSEHHKLAEAVAALTSELQNENKELVKKDEEHQECLKTVEALKKSLKDHGQDRENRLQALEKEIKSLKKNLTSVSKDFKAQETARERLIMEKDAAIQEMQALGIELSTSQQQITKLEEAIGEVEAKVRESGLRYCGYRRQMK
jgi:structural maintenance of chromosome 2